MQQLQLLNIVKLEISDLQIKQFVSIKEFWSALPLQNKIMILIRYVFCAMFKLRSDAENNLSPDGLIESARNLSFDVKLGMVMYPRYLYEESIIFDVIDMCLEWLLPIIVQ